MAWEAVTTSSSLSLSGSFQTVQEGGGDMEIVLTPQERAHVQISYDPQDAAPTENALAIIQTSSDGGTTWDTDLHPYHAAVLLFDEDPATLSFVVSGVQRFRVRARLIDPDGSDGGDDTASLIVRVKTDGVDT